MTFLVLCVFLLKSFKPFFLTRYAIPQPAVQSKPFSSKEIEIAERLFGKKNIFQNETMAKNPSPMVIFCKNRKDGDFKGEMIDGFSTKFCNDFFPTPTDVGICMTENIDIRNIVRLDNDFSNFMEVGKRMSAAKIGAGNRNAENTFILLTDTFEKSDITQTSPVNFKYLS